MQAGYWTDTTDRHLPMNSVGPENMLVRVFSRESTTPSAHKISLKARGADSCRCSADGAGSLRLRSSGTSITGKACRMFSFVQGNPSRYTINKKVFA